MREIDQKRSLAVAGRRGNEEQFALDVFVEKIDETLAMEQVGAFARQKNFGNRVRRFQELSPELKSGHSRRV